MDKLANYYSKYGVDLKAMLGGNSTPNRFIRLNPRFDAKETLLMIQAELPPDSSYPKLVPWLDASSFGAFYAMPGDFRLAQSKAYQQGRIYGQDISSGVAVAVLMKEEDDNTNKHDGAETSRLHSNNRNTKKTIRILDLCCAPGLKLCALADWLTGQQQSSSITSSTQSVVVGVDLHKERLDVAKNVIYKYHLDPDKRGSRTTTTLITRSKKTTATHEKDHIPPCDSATNNCRPLIRIRLFQGDGTTIFSKYYEDAASQYEKEKLLFDSTAAWEEQLSSADKNGTERKRRNNKSSRARERKRLKLLQVHDRQLREEQHQLHQQEEKGDAMDTTDDEHLFDRVLVDAECSTDGSLKHVEKVLQQHAANQQSEYPKDKDTNNILSLLDDKSKMDKLHDLQKSLAFNGFRLLSRGGFMVYSTCSLEQGQNEEIVQSLLEEHSNAVLVPVRRMMESKLVVEGSLKGTIRFLPNTDKTEEFLGGGFFVAKIGKN